MKHAKSKKRASSKADAQAFHGARDAEKLRARVAWMYYVEQRRQNDIADILSIGRVTVVRLLAEARSRNEVQITLSGDLSEITALERELEATFGLEEAVVAPMTVAGDNPIPVISAATGAFLSRTVKSGMRFGVGWGGTLYGSLPYIHSQSLDDFRVISLLGGIIQARRFNPAEFAWQFAEIFQGEGFLIPAPAIVDSEETRRSLLERCGIDSIFDMAASLDAVLLSVGGLKATTTTFKVGYLNNVERASLKSAGAVGDLLFHFFDKNGDIVDHEINQRVMSVGIDVIRNTPLKIMASGGPEKVLALLGSMKLCAPNVLITDEQTAISMLKKATA